MTETKKDSKQEETETLSEESTDEKKSDSQEEEEPLKKQEDEETKNLLAKELKARQDFEAAFKKEERLRKELEIELEAKKQVSESQGTEIPDWFRTKQEQERKEVLILAQKQIAEEYPFLHKENDLDGENWTKFKEHSDKYGGPRSHTLDGIKDEYRGFLRMAGLLAEKIQSSETLVEDSGIGDTTASIKGEKKEPDTLTRKLNKYEQEAAENFPGGEPAYRAKLAELQKKRSLS